MKKKKQHRPPSWNKDWISQTNCKKKQQQKRDFPQGKTHRDLLREYGEDRMHILYGKKNRRLNNLQQRQRMAGVCFFHGGSFYVT